MSATTAMLPELSDVKPDPIKQVSEYILFIPSAKYLPYIHLKSGKRTVLGRGSSTNDQQPDVDLSLYGARENGVSRIHAVIEFQDEDIRIVDLGSSNGTHLNGKRLQPHQQHALQDRDEIRLGKLVLHALFQYDDPDNKQ